MKTTKTLKKAYSFYLNGPFGLCFKFVGLALGIKPIDYFPLQINVSFSTRNPKKKGWIKGIFNAKHSVFFPHLKEKFEICSQENEFLKQHLKINDSFWIKVEDATPQINRQSV